MFKLICEFFVYFIALGLILDATGGDVVRGKVKAKQSEQHRVRHL